MTTETTNTVKLPDSVICIPLARDGSGQLHCLAPVSGHFLGIKQMDSGYAAVFVPCGKCRSISGGDAFQCDSPLEGLN